MIKSMTAWLVYLMPSCASSGFLYERQDDLYELHKERSWWALNETPCQADSLPDFIKFSNKNLIIDLPPELGFLQAMWSLYTKGRDHLNEDIPLREISRIQLHRKDRANPVIPTRQNVGGNAKAASLVSMGRPMSFRCRFD